MTKLEQIQKLKDEAVQEILNNPNLSKHEKLTEISNGKLWDYHSSIQHVFCAQEKKFKKQVMKETGKSFACIDDFICDPDSYRERNEDVDMAIVIENLLDDAKWNKTDEVEVLSCCGSDMIYKMKLDEVIDVIYDWCVKNKAIGFKFDW